MYSLAALETMESEAAEKLFVSIVRSLARDTFAYESDTYPAVWINVVYRSELGRFFIGLLNYQELLPGVPVDRVAFSLRPPQGRHFTRLLLIPGETPMPFTTNELGVLHAESSSFELFQAFLAETDANGH